VDPQQAPDLDLQRKVNQLLQRSSWSRTSDIAPDELVPGRIIPKATSTKADWFGPFTVDRPSVFQLMSVGLDVTHLVCLSHKSPDDTMFSEGRVRRNALGKGYCLAVGDYWAYVPLLAGDPAFFQARLSDASSDLPAQQNALDDGGPVPGATVVTTLNRSDGFTAYKTVAVPGTAENCAAQVIPGGFELAIVANPLNTDYVGIAFSAAAADLVTGTPVILAPGQPLKYKIGNANLIWVDALVAGEGVILTAEI